MDTLAYIADKYGLDLDHRSPIEIPDMGRDDLPGLFAELGYAVGVEVGTEQGFYAETLCQGVPGLHLYCVDAWDAYNEYRDHRSQSKLDRFYDEAVERLAPFHVDIVRQRSMDAVGQFDDGSLDFVYIDANHEIPYVLNDICAWRQKVRSGGVVAGHDYYKSRRRNTRCHVVYAVQCVTQSFRIKPWFLLGLRAKLPGLTRDKHRSWMWVE